MTTQNHKVDIAVIGAGSAGLTAFRKTSKTTDRILLIDHGPLGTTCARTGCMPSKALIHVARDFHNRRSFESEGIRGAEHLACELPAVLKHVRNLRDKFTNGMIQAIEELAGKRLLRERAVLLDKHHIQAGAHRIEAEQIIIATGTKPLVPKTWKKFSGRIFTSDTIFEQESLPPRIAVIGLGPVGLELGQALARLGVEITGFEAVKLIGGLSDPDVNNSLQKQISLEFPLYTGAPAELEEDGNGLLVKAGEQHVHTDAVLVAMGSIPNLDGIGLETLGIKPESEEKPLYNLQTGQIGDMPVYIAGDANGLRPMLHEALDDGMIAADHALHKQSSCACRRVPLRIVFCDPEVIIVGTPFSELSEAKTVVGTVDFSEQARATIENRNAGRLNLYADSETAQLLGAEAAVPDSGHLGHLLALAIQRKCTVFDLLQMPFYHPTLTEALRTALRDAAKNCPERRKREAGRILDWCCVEKPLR